MKIDWRVQDEETGPADVGGPGDGAAEQTSAPNAMDADETQSLVDGFRKFEADHEEAGEAPPPAEPARQEGAAPASPAPAPQETPAAPVDERTMIADFARSAGLDPREFEQFQTVDEVRRAVDLTSRHLQRMLLEAQQQQVEQAPAAPAGYGARQAPAAVERQPVPPIDWGEGGREAWDPHAARMFEQQHAAIHEERQQREALAAELHQLRTWRQQTEAETRSRVQEDIARRVDEAIESLGDADLYGTGDYARLTAAQQAARERAVRFCQQEIAQAFAQGRHGDVKSIVEAAHRGLHFDRVTAAREKARLEEARNQSQKRLGTPGRPPQKRPPEQAEYDYRLADPDLAKRLTETLSRLDE